MYDLRATGVHTGMGTKSPANELVRNGLEIRSTSWAGAALGSEEDRDRFHLDGTGASARVVWVPAPLHVDRLGNLPEHDPDHGHRLAGNKVLVIQRGTLAVPLSKEFVLA
jgi:hypothetical protein